MDVHLAQDPSRRRRGLGRGDCTQRRHRDAQEAEVGPLARAGDHGDVREIVHGVGWPAASTSDNSWAAASTQVHSLPAPLPPPWVLECEFDIRRLPKHHFKPN